MEYSLSSDCSGKTPIELPEEYLCDGEDY